mgnify:FL=1
MAPGPKQNKKQSNSNGNDAELIPGMGRLTQRELEIFTLIDLGLSTRELTAKLDVSAYTVQNHRNHIKDKLSLPDSAAITYWAVSGRITRSSPFSLAAKPNRGNNPAWLPIQID